VELLGTIDTSEIVYKRRMLIQSPRALKGATGIKNILRNRVFVFGVLSPFAAILLYGVVYSTLTSLSSNLENDWLRRLIISAFAMVIPSLFTFAFAVRQSRTQKAFPILSKVGVVLAILALGLAAKPVSDCILRSKQEKNMALHDVAAPPFETPDISGTVERLSDQKGKVVVINRWATWCAPCRIEMPDLDQLYRAHKSEGLVVFGLSDEDVATQEKFLSRVSVSYPLLTMTNGIPNFYRDIARYPAIFLVDRQGHLQAAPAPGEPFSKVETSVDTLLSAH
jgi:peroxiredoxin